MRLRNIIIAAAALASSLIGANATTTVTFNAADFDATDNYNALSKTVDGVEFSFSSAEITHDGVARVICKASSSVLITAPEGKLITSVEFASTKDNGSTMTVVLNSSMLVPSAATMTGTINSDYSQTFTDSAIGQNSVSFTNSVMYMTPSISVTLADTSATCADDAMADKKAEVRKLMRDGVVYIIKGDEVYGVNGNRVK